MKNDKHITYFLVKLCWKAVDSHAVDASACRNVIEFHSGQIVLIIVEFYVESFPIRIGKQSNRLAGATTLPNNCKKQQHKN
jgi:hypothetical protein